MTILDWVKDKLFARHAREERYKALLDAIEDNSAAAQETVRAVRRLHNALRAEDLSVIERLDDLLDSVNTPKSRPEHGHKVKNGNGNGHE